MGCSNAPETISIGEFESPCTSTDDCNSGPCLVIDGFGTCTQSCSSGSHCPAGYVCDQTQRACVPSISGQCRELYDRCGPHYPRCCDGLGCVEFEDWGPRCVTVGCAYGGSHRCEPGFCCLEVGSDTVCAPPTYCP